MGDARRVFGTIQSRDDLERLFHRLADEIDVAPSRLRLNELYERAVYLVVLTRSPSWRRKVADEADTLGAFASIEFARLARRVNRRAADLGAAADYSETR
jgi:hypothetical protein